MIVKNREVILVIYLLHEQVWGPHRRQATRLASPGKHGSLGASFSFWTTWLLFKENGYKNGGLLLSYQPRIVKIGMKASYIMLFVIYVWGSIGLLKSSSPFQTVLHPLRTSESCRKRRMVPCSPKIDPQEFWMVQYFCDNSLSCQVFCRLPPVRVRAMLPTVLVTSLRQQVPRISGCDTMPLSGLEKRNEVVTMWRLLGISWQSGIRSQRDHRTE